MAGTVVGVVVNTVVDAAVGGRNNDGETEVRGGRGGSGGVPCRERGQGRDGGRGGDEVEGIVDKKGMVKEDGLPNTAHNHTSFGSYLHRSHLIDNQFYSL